MTAHEFLKRLNRSCFGFMSRERDGLASNGELFRWLERRSVEIDGERPGPRDDVAFPVRVVVLFPSSPLRVTL